MNRLISFIIFSLLCLQAFFAKVEANDDPAMIPTQEQATDPPPGDPQRSGNSSSVEFSDMSFRNLTLSILPNSNTSHTTTTSTTSHPHPHPPQRHGRRRPPKIPKESLSHKKLKSRPMPMFSNPMDSQRHPHFQCIATVPRMNLVINKLLGIWYPLRYSQSTLNLWSQSFQKQYKLPMRNTSCFMLEYNAEDASNTNLTAISLAVHRANQSINVGAILIGDDKHPKGSKWAISWPNGEDTLTSVVAAGVVGKERNQYSWLLTVDCDINGIVESDWAVMARVPEGITNATLNAIFAILEGLKGIKVEHAIAYQSEHCHK